MTNNPVIVACAIAESPQTLDSYTQVDPPSPVTNDFAILGSSRLIAPYATPAVNVWIQAVDAAGNNMAGESINTSTDPVTGLPFVSKMRFSLG
jgi:hypothetical protein